MNHTGSCYHRKPRSGRISGSESGSRVIGCSGTRDYTAPPGTSPVVARNAHSERLGGGPSQPLSDEGNVKGNMRRRPERPTLGPTQLDRPRIISRLYRFVPIPRSGRRSAEILDKYCCRSELHAESSAVFYGLRLGEVTAFFRRQIREKNRLPTQPPYIRGG